MAEKEIKSKTIVWEDSVSIENAQQKKQELQKAFNSSNEILLDISKLEDIDISGVQLIIASQKESQIRKVDFKVTGEISSNLTDFFRKIGIPIAKLTSAEQFTTEILETIAGDEDA